MKENTTTEGKNNQPQEAKLPHLSALEEDDEFEDFAAEDWNDNDEDPTEANLWDDNWDDDDVDDDFSNQLKAELAKQTGPHPMKM